MDAFIGRVVLVVLFDLTAFGETRFVNVDNATPSPPYANWETAASIIQDAIDAAEPGDEIVVTNGVYGLGGRAVAGFMTNRVVLDKALHVRSVNGPAFTFIVGHQVPGATNGDGAVRCAYLTNGAVMDGFTLTNGATRISGDEDQEQTAGGAWSASADAILTNCVLAGNSARYGGAVYGGTVVDSLLAGNHAMGGGAAYYSTLSNCTLRANSALWGGGAYESVLDHCVLTNNRASYGGGAYSGTLTSCVLVQNWATNTPNSRGGGTFESQLSQCSLFSNSASDRGGGSSGGNQQNCVLTNNSANDGGGIYAGSQTDCLFIGNTARNAGGAAYFGGLNNCVLAANTASFAGGTYFSWLRNCQLYGNSASLYGGGAVAGTLYNCTIVSNSAPSAGGAYATALRNSIVYYNYATNAANSADSSLSYCCTVPLPSQGQGNFTDEPLFVDLTAGDLRLQSNSPCINGGNNHYFPAGTDLDGAPRIAGGTIDVGAYEFQAPASSLAYAWLQRYSLPTDGSADHADPDADGLNNWQEWKCLTDPTNAASALRVVGRQPDGTNVLIRWQSVAGLSYFLERSTNFRDRPAFVLLATNLTGEAGTTTYTDTNIVIDAPRFYRVGVKD